MQPSSMDDKKNPELSQTLTTSLASPVPAVVEQTGDNDVSKTIQALSRKKKSTGQRELNQLLKSNMARSCGNSQAGDVDLSQRSRRKKRATTGENLESSSSGQGSDKGKRALYHCNYCNKDITGQIRIKCAECADFDLCVQCFSVGAEVTPHKNSHSYRVMDDLSFPVFCADWNAEDETLLLEGLEMHGFGNWAAVAEHVGTKSKEQCIEHYTNVYLNSPCFPLPDMSHMAGKNKEELIAMAQVNGEDKKEGESKACSSNAANTVHTEDGLNAIKMEDPQAGRNLKGKKPSSSRNDDPSLMEISGYNPKRQEFDIEYDNDAEKLLADMEFRDSDTEEEHELKLRVLHIYNKRLDERKRRKDFILERNLLHPNPFFKDLSPEEIALCRTYDVFMRFHSKEEHEDFLKTIVNEHRILKRIQELKEARAAGCRTSAEAYRYLEQRRKREAEELSQRENKGAQVGTSSQAGPSASTRQGSSSSFSVLDIMGFKETELLSESEKRLCIDTRLPPPLYLKMQQVISEEIFRGKVTKKSDAHRLFEMEPSKIDRVYDMLVKKGLAPP
ncbi:hypothetical protein SLA2020_482920 [Shorea laevis]